QYLPISTNEQFQFLLGRVELDVDDILDRLVIDSQQFISRTQLQFGGHAPALHADDSPTGKGHGIDLLKQGHQVGSSPRGRSVSSSAIISIITSFAVRPVVSITIASAAGRKGECRRLLSI